MSPFAPNGNDAVVVSDEERMHRLFRDHNIFVESVRRSSRTLDFNAITDRGCIYPLDLLGLCIRETDRTLPALCQWLFETVTRMAADNPAFSVKVHYSVDTGCAVTRGVDGVSIDHVAASLASTLRTVEWTPSSKFDLHILCVFAGTNTAFFNEREVGDYFRQKLVYKWTGTTVGMLDSGRLPATLPVNGLRHAVCVKGVKLTKMDSLPALSELWLAPVARSARAHPSLDLRVNLLVQMEQRPQREGVHKEHLEVNDVAGTLTQAVKDAGWESHRSPFCVVLECVFTNPVHEAELDRQMGGRQRRMFIETMRRANTS